jgi:superfamily II DNA or RNA helicase
MVSLDKLRPHQVEPVRHLVSILRARQSAVDLSDMGTGKTFVACAVAAELQLPTMVVVPKVAVTAWERAAAHFDERFTVIGYEKLRTGKTGFGWWDNALPPNADLEYFKCQCCQLPVDIEQDGTPGINYSPCYTHPAGFHCLETHRKAWNYGKFNYHAGVKLIIFDEMHRCGAMDSLNAEMMIAAKRQNIKMLGLSATAACSPLNMRALGYNLDLHNDKTDFIVPERIGGVLYGSKLAKPNFFRWASRYGCRRDARFHGFKWLVGKDKQRDVMKDIRLSIIPARGVRVTTDEIPGFPDREVSAELYDLDEVNTIDRLYAEMAESIQQLDTRSEQDDDPELRITKILRARQKIELLKVPVAVELARDHLNKGHSVGIFVNFSQTLKELRTRLKCNCFIDGSADGVRYRQQAIDGFNSNSEQLILINSEAGGVAVSLPDLTGEHPRVGLVFPGFNATTFRQLLGRFHRENSRSRCHYRVIFAANTVEVTAHRNLCAKLNNIDAINSEDMMPENLHLSLCSIDAILGSR